MITNIQYWKPASCGCQFEETFDRADPDGTRKLFYADIICPKHEPLVKNKPKLSQEKLLEKRTEIINLVEDLLTQNKTKNLKQYDDHPLTKQKLDTIKDMKHLLKTESTALRLEAILQAERQNVEKDLDDFTDKQMNHFLLGVHSPYAFSAQDAYDQVKKEQTGS